MIRKDDWITELYYKQLSDKSKDNNHSGKNVSSKKEIPRTQDKPKNRKWGINS